MRYSNFRDRNFVRDGVSCLKGKDAAQMRITNTA